MKFEVIKEKSNPLLKRKEILMSIDYEGSATPSKADFQKTLSEHFKVEIERVEISKILSEFGLPKGKAWIKIWDEKRVPIYSEIKKEEKKEEPKQEKVEEKPKEQGSDQ